MDGARDTSQTADEIDRRAGTVEIQRVELIWKEMDRRLWTVEKLAKAADLSRSLLDGWPAKGPVRAHRRTVEKIVAAFERHPVSEMLAEWLSPGEG